MVSKSVMDALESRIVTKKEGAARQIDVAIKLFEEGEYESSITLSCAAEGMLLSGERQPLFDRLKARKPDDFRSEKEWTTFLNLTRDWLKHSGDQQDHGISQFEGWVALVRALTKYHVFYGEETAEMSAFIKRARQRGLTEG